MASTKRTAVRHPAGAIICRRLARVGVKSRLRFEAETLLQVLVNSTVPDARAAGFTQLQEIFDDLREFGSDDRLEQFAELTWYWNVCRDNGHPQYMREVRRALLALGVKRFAIAADPRRTACDFIAGNSVNVLWGGSERRARE